MTELDRAYAAMAAAGEGDDGPRLRYYAALADGEMILVLSEEAGAGAVVPRVFELEDGPVVLIFDGEEKLAGFSPGPVPYAALPGRVIAQQLAGQGIGLGVNMGAASMMLFPPDAVDWLAEMLNKAPEAAAGRPVAFHAPEGLPEVLVTALQGKLARSGGVAAAALLAGVTYEGGRRGHMLAFLDADAAAHGMLARAVSEALIFSGIAAGEMDVAFLASGNAGAVAMAKVAMRLDMSPADRKAPVMRAAPGSDPAKPPKLR
ncbi:MAG: SseB family protein [Paracoccaceae bacterium]